MDLFTALRVFEKVVEEGGLSAAGRVLGMSPSTVSRWIRELERDLNVQLMHRTTRALSLTEAGAIYHERTREVLESLEAARAAATEQRTNPAGVVRLAAPTNITRTHVVPALAAFQRAYPQIRIVLSVSDRRVDVVGEAWDVAIRIGRLEPSSLRVRRLAQTRRILCASPEYLERAGVPSKPSDLEDHACLTFRRHLSPALWAFAQCPPVRVSGDLVTDSGDALVAAACAGLGVIMVPEALVHHVLREGHLVELLSAYTPDPALTPLSALYAAGTYTPPKVRVLIDFLNGFFARQEAWSTVMR